MVKTSPWLYQMDRDTCSRKYSLYDLNENAPAFVMYQTHVSEHCYTGMIPNEQNTIEPGLSDNLGLTSNL